MRLAAALDNVEDLGGDLCRCLGVDPLDERPDLNVPGELGPDLSVPGELDPYRSSGRACTRYRSVFPGGAPALI